MQKTAIGLALLTAAGLSTAQEMGQVISATPIVQQVTVPQQSCYEETVMPAQRASTGGGAILGAVVGGLIGSALGSGSSGRTAAAMAGAFGGAIVGDQAENRQPAYPQQVQRCQTQNTYENRTMGYTVVYEYAGRQYNTRTQYDPGRWIPVSVQPATGQSYSNQPDPYASQGVYSQPGVVTSTYPQQPVYQPPPTYVTPPVTVIEYGYDSRPHYPHHRNPYWR